MLVIAISILNTNATGDLSFDMALSLLTYLVGEWRDLNLAGADCVGPQRLTIHFPDYEATQALDWERREILK